MSRFQIHLLILEVYGSWVWFSVPVPFGSRQNFGSRFSVPVRFLLLNSKYQKRKADARALPQKVIEKEEKVPQNYALKWLWKESKDWHIDWTSKMANLSTFWVKLEPKMKRSVPKSLRIRFSVLKRIEDRFQEPRNRTPLPSTYSSCVWPSHSDFSRDFFSYFFVDGNVNN